MDSTAPASPATQEDRTVAIVSYLTIIGFIVAVVIHSNKKTQVGAFHLRQSLGILLTGFAAGVVGIVPILGWLIALVSIPVLLVFWVMGLIGAINGQTKPLPLLGEHYQKWFAGAFV